MATVSTAGFSGFNAALFREKIKATMRMGLPQNPALRATFKWLTVNTYSAHDSNGNPWSFSSVPATTSAHADVLIDCAVEFKPRATLAGGTEVGHFDTPRVVLTVLDDDYALVIGATHVLLGTNTYNIDFIAPPAGLFEVTIYEIHLSAVDES